jgi:hypothetical protein
VPVNPEKKRNMGGRVSWFSKDIDFHSTYWIALDMGLISEEKKPINQTLQKE